MKVLQILPELNYGGVEVGTVDMAYYLLKMGHQPYVISAGGKQVRVLEKMGVPHYTLPVNKKNWQAIGAIREVAEIILREKIDIVHARSRIPAWIAYFATRKTQATFITTCHGYYSHHVISTIMGWGKNVIVISNSIGRRMIDTFQVPPDRIRLVHRGLDIDKYAFNTRRFAQTRKKRKDKYVIANIARITPLKGHKDFLQAIRIAKMQFPTIEVWLIGSAAKKKKYGEEIVAMIEKLGLSDSVTLMGARADIPQLLQEVDLLVLSTTVPEGFGRVLIEAGASGVPVIATKVGGVLDVIEDGIHGYLIPPNEPDKMSDAIIRVLDDYAQHKDMAELFRKRIEDNFTLELMAKKTVAVYQEALARKHIMVIKLGALGDLILVVPSLRALRATYPTAIITLVVDSKLTPLMELCPYVDNVISVNRAKKNSLRRFWRLVKKLRKLYCDISVDFQNTKWTHALAFFADVRRRYGYTRGICGHLLTNGIPFQKDTLAPIDHQARILNLFGISTVKDTLELWVSDEDRASVAKMLADTWIAPSQRLVGFVLNASCAWKTKNWPLDYFIELAARLEKDLQVRVVLLGDDSNTQVAEQFLLRADTETINLVGKTSLREMVALVDRLNCLVSGDTAPIHVASAMKTPTVAFFGPTNALRHAPPGHAVKVMKRNLPCMPCYKKQCKHGACMKDISVDEVFTLVKRYLKGNGQ